ncbi:MAG: type II toxin-antitoxin system VapC family toxin [Burkholderiales bacterium]
MNSYLDTSVIVPLFVDEAVSDVISLWAEKQTRALIVADLTVTEFNAVISRLVRQNAFDEARAVDTRQQFEQWRTAATEPLENLPVDVRAAGRLVATALPRLLSADAIHLATCRRLDLTLVTSDHDLQRIAEREGVRWVCPS